MKALPTLTLLLLVAAVFCGAADLRDAHSFSADGGRLQDEWLSPNPLMILRRLARRPRPQQFFSLMGRRSAGQKLSSLVGLMGRRRQVDAGLSDWSTGQNYERRQ
ncbi:protachykinin-like [Arapaima gigas]